jgi:hypothetical protein
MINGVDIRPIASAVTVSAMNTLYECDEYTVCELYVIHTDTPERVSHQ